MEADETEMEATLMVENYIEATTGTHSSISHQPHVSFHLYRECYASLGFRIV